MTIDLNYIMNTKNTIRKIAIAYVLVGLVGFTQVTTRTVKSSSVSFVIKNFGLDVDGSLKDLQVIEFVFDNDSLSSSKIDITIGTKTINTGNEKRDEHLRKPDYFDADKYPTIRMRSKRFGKSKAGNAIGYFDLTLKGVTKEVKLPIFVTKLGELTQFKSIFTINRLDYGVGESSMALSDDVKITVLIKTN